MVRLVVQSKITDYLDFEFQFHYGTIGSKEREGRILSKYLFQFHYGTIGSLIMLYFYL